MRKNGIDSRAFVAIIVVITLPKRAIAVDRNFIRISEILAQYFHMTAIGIAAKGEALFVSFSVENGFSVFVL